MKHSDPAEHEKLTRQKQESVLQFARALEQEKIPMVVRHVLVPGITDQEQQLRSLGQILASYRNLKGLDVLPYHKMGLKKYESLGLKYPLEGVEAMDKGRAKKARELILAEIRRIRGKEKQ